MCPFVGGNHHACGEKVFDFRYAEGTIGDSVGAAIFYLEAGREVVEAVDEHIIVEMPAFNDVFVGYVVVAGDEPAPSDAEFRAGSGDKCLFAAGDVFSEDFNGFCLPFSQFKFGPGDCISICGADRHFEIQLDEHEVFVVNGGGDG